MRRGALSILAVGAAALLAWLLLTEPPPQDKEDVAALLQEDITPAATSEPELRSAPQRSQSPSGSPVARLDPDTPSLPAVNAPSTIAAAPAPSDQPAAPLQPGVEPVAEDPASERQVSTQDAPAVAEAPVREEKGEEKGTSAAVAEPPADPATPAAEEPAESETELAALSPAMEEAATPDPVGADPAQDTPSDAAAAESTPPPGAPVFDLVRVSPDGQVVVAGRADPGAKVEVVLEGEVAGEVEADNAGAFVAIIETEPSQEARQMLLRVQDPSDDAVPAAENAAPAASARAADAVPESDPEAAAEEAPADASESAKEPATPAPRYLASAPVIILPSGNPSSAPVLVRTDEAAVDVVQPAPLTPGERMALDRITYEAGGDVIAAGRGENETAVRTYANGILVTETAVAETGGWQATIPGRIAADADLLRFDAVSSGGEVTSRVETAFAYETDGADLAVRTREVTIQRGNNLWRLAEQHYGEGIRYSVIFSANAELIRDPDLIYPGQVFTVPELVNSE